MLNWQCKPCNIWGPKVVWPDNCMTSENCYWQRHIMSDQQPFLCLFLLCCTHDNLFPLLTNFNFILICYCQIYNLWTWAVPNINVHFISDRVALWSLSVFGRIVLPTISIWLNSENCYLVQLYSKQRSEEVVNGCHGDTGLWWEHSLVVIRLTEG